MKALFTKFRLSIYFFLACIVIQLGIITWLYPSPEDFKVTETVTGLFTFDGGGSRPGSTSHIAGRGIFCAINYTGPSGSCSSRFENQVVIAKLAKYKYLTGSGDVAMEIASVKDAEISSYSPENRVQNWLISSLWETLRSALFFTVFFYIIQSTYFNKNGAKHGN